MFNVEPQEKWSKEDAAEFEKHVAKQDKKIRRDAAWATAALLVTILSVIPFLEGHVLHPYWDKAGKYLVLLAMVLLLWFVLKAGAVWASWQSARETRREFGDPE